MADRRSAKVAIGACVIWVSLVVAPHAAAQDTTPPVEQSYYWLTVFGRLNYLSDSFKQVDYLLSPTVGVGYAWVDNDLTTLSFDASLGTVFERNPGFDVRTIPALALGQRLTHQNTDAARVTEQSFVPFVFVFCRLFNQPDMSDVMTAVPRVHLEQPVH